MRVRDAVGRTCLDRAVESGKHASRMIRYLLSPPCGLQGTLTAAEKKRIVEALPMDQVISYADYPLFRRLLVDAKVFDPAEAADALTLVLLQLDYNLRTSNSECLQHRSHYSKPTLAVQMQRAVMPSSSSCQCWAKAPCLHSLSFVILRNIAYKQRRAQSDLKDRSCWSNGAMNASCR